MRWLQGGFARCYLYSDIAKRRQVAGKVIASASLTKQRHVEKVGRAAGCALPASATHR